MSRRRALPLAMIARPLRVLMISSEVDPFARTGGLGDVVGGLSLALAQLGADVVVVTPLYRVTRVSAPASFWSDPVVARIGWGPSDVRPVGVLEVPGKAGPGGSHRVCLAANDELFGSRGIYDDPAGRTYADNAVRFVALSRAALAIAERVWGSPEAGGGPDIIHAHDWHTAPAVISARTTMGDAWRAKASVFTIHNLAFQGLLGFGTLDQLQLPRGAFYDGTLAHEGNVNLMKGAILLSDRVTTVSPTYAREILSREEGFGLDGILRGIGPKLVGILNGIDADRFDPRTDGAIQRPYDADTAVPARQACKDALLAETGLDAGEGPLFATVTRLSEQKGIDLALGVAPALVEGGGRLLVVGEGDIRLEAGLRAMCGRFPGRVAARITFDPPLARRVYAGADFFVMPSRYEPCGLTQMYAMRYGAIPIVTGVGGLFDTVARMDSAHGTGTGFVAAAPTTTDLLVACEDALTFYPDTASRISAIRRAMSRDDSWKASAAVYMRLFESLVV
jgi:starch synthase